MISAIEARVPPMRLCNGDIITMDLKCLQTKELVREVAHIIDSGQENKTDADLSEGLCKGDIITMDLKCLQTKELQIREVTHIIDS